MRISHYIPLILMLAAAAFFSGCASTSPTQTGGGDSAESAGSSETAYDERTPGGSRLLMDRYKSGDIPGYRN